MFLWFVPKWTDWNAAQITAFNLASNSHRIYLFVHTNDNVTEMSNGKSNSFYEMNCEILASIIFLWMLRVAFWFCVAHFIRLHSRHLSDFYRVNAVYANHFFFTPRRWKHTKTENVRLQEKCEAVAVFLSSSSQHAHLLSPSFNLLGSAKMPAVEKEARW